MVASPESGDFLLRSQEPGRDSMHGFDKTVAATESEVFDFMIENGIERMGTFKPGEPVLCVLPDMVRNDTGFFSHMPRNERPSVALLHGPISFDTSVRFPQLSNKGQQADYYFINDRNNPIYLYSSISGEKPYVIEPSNLFRANEIFPKIQGEKIRWKNKKRGM